MNHYFLEELSTNPIQNYVKFDFCVTVHVTFFSPSPDFFSCVFRLFFSLNIYRKLLCRSDDEDDDMDY